MASKQCKNDVDSFCFICGEFIKVRSKKFALLTNLKLCEAYEAYFNLKISNQNENWVPHFACVSCKNTLEAWYRGENRHMKFAMPRIWREPSDHVHDCYFCMVNPSKRRSGKNAEKIFYPDLPSTSSPIPHDENLPVPARSGLDSFEVQASQSSTGSSAPLTNTDGSDFMTKSQSFGPHFISSSEFNDLVRDLNLSKNKAEILGSRLKQWNLLEDGVKITDQRERHKTFSCFFTKEAGICYCNNVTDLFNEIGIPFVASDWRLFIDSSSKSLKAVLLHNGNELPSLPLAHSVLLKESYDSVKIILEKLKYTEYQWSVIGDFKMVGFLMGMQGGYTKYPCHLCLWDSRADSVHYQQRKWPDRVEFQIGKHNVKSEPIVKPQSILMPPLHIKLGIMKQFVKALDPSSKAFEYLRGFFPKLSEAKVKGGIFVGPQIKQIMKSDDFTKLLNAREKPAWESFKAVVDGFLGNHRAINYAELIEKMLESFKVMSCRMSHKLHMLHSHLDEFKDNMGAYSEEQGERFHQDVMDFERRYQGQYNENMMGDYIWGLVRESSYEHKRNTKNIHF
ncbi:uncharacterized protein LOC123266115 [Cotesia glomerata]|uniref:uncharacterized protein LOC123266115 n=1 Tax=Cotesia glomerata TaxID=32391 RepID=UPI001D02BE4D|nr:uncharacterized protein LOC123266115 [Cotesia glomerata]